MLEADLHAHTFFSNCGIHSHIEMLLCALDKGMKALAITDHGPALSGRVSSTVFDRMYEPVAGIKFLKGMECNLLEEPGRIDMPEKLLKYMDIVLLGIHPNTPKGLDAVKYTDMLIKAMEKNPCVDILTHIYDPVYPVEFAPVAEFAGEKGFAIELNNSKTLLGRVEDGITRRLVEACINAGCRVVVTSDAHTVDELGRDDSVMPFLLESGFPMLNLISRNAESVYSFIEERRPNK